MSEFLRRIRERKLVRWVIAYGAGAWLALEVVDMIGGVWGWPLVVGQVVFVVLAFGLLAAIVLAWYHGERGRQRASRTELILLTAILLGAGVVIPVVLRRAADESEATSATRAQAGDLRSLVVLPFADLSPARDQGYLGDGIAETLINSLARVEGLRVVARTSAFRYRGETPDVRTIGRDLGVAAVLEGSVLQLGDRVRITAQLVDARSGLDIWSDRFDREAKLEDLFALQDDVAGAIVAALRVRLDSTAQSCADCGGARPHIVSRGTRDPDAQRAYYVARHHWNARTAHDLVRAEALFREAIAADSAYADAWAGLAETYVLFTPSEYDVRGTPEAVLHARVEETARKAIALDSTLAAPHVALGRSFDIRGRADAAERAYREAIRKNPGYATAHQWYADYLMAYGRGAEAIAEMEIAESLDPVSGVILVEMAEALLVVGRTDEAVTQVDRAAALHPSSLVVRWIAAWVHGAARNWDGMAVHVGRWLELDGEDDTVIAHFVQGLADAERRDAVLRQIADGRTAEVGVRLQTSIGSLNSPQTRFLAARAVYGDDRALTLLETLARGPERRWVYRPAIAALMGPALLADPRGRRILALLNAAR